MTEFIPNPRWSRHTFQVNYLAWMIKVNHPDLRNSNYQAEKFRELNQEQSSKLYGEGLDSYPPPC